MKSLLKKIPARLITLIKLLSISFLMLFITRVLFYLFNSHAFSGMGFYYWLLGLWFDIITICLWMLPFYIIYLLPIKWNQNIWFNRISALCFHLINAVMILLNLIDIEYFKYTGKRSTSDLFTTVTTGSDFGQLLGSFLADFWFLLIIFCGLIYLSIYLFKRINQNKPEHFNFLSEFSGFFIGVVLLFLIGRGGFGIRPIGIIEAAKYTDGQYTSFVLPTPFTIIKTISQDGLEKKNYFSETELKKHFNPIKKSKPANIFEGKPNVVIIMLESFGNEFVGFNNNGNGFTPFLDSIMAQSLSFDYAFANGKKSIEAVPAIVSSLPTLMNDSYISSPYGVNTINSLPSILKKSGYSSGFYHGATNGSMSFDGFAKICGFDSYYGRTEYNNEDHSDGKWGILDEYFNPWAVRKMSKQTEPFFATLFTLSSHHPYFIPDHMQAKVKRGSQDICASISYADISLKMFFEEAKKQSWYNNTIFVLMADHTPASITPKYFERRNLYRIPIAFYDPQGRIKPERSQRLFQQLDVLPTILDLVNIETKFYSFGSSFYQNNTGEAITFISGSYHYFYDKHLYTFTDDKISSIINFETGKKVSIEKKKLLKVTNRIKAIIQTYNNDLISNSTSVK